MIKMKFKDAPVGARFKYPYSESIWVKINSYPKSHFNDGNGLICSWDGNVKGHQSFCSFVDEKLGIDFDTEVELIFNYMTKKEIKEKVKFLEKNGLSCPNVSKLRGNVPNEMFFEAYSKDIQELNNNALNTLKLLSSVNPPKQKERLECTNLFRWEPRFSMYPYGESLTYVVKEWLNYFETKTSIKSNEIIVSNGDMKYYIEKSTEYDKTNSTFQNIKVIFKDCTRNIIKIYNTEYEKYSLGIIGVL